MKDSTIVVTSRVKHNGRYYGKGEELVLPEAQAARLLKLGVAKNIQDDDIDNNSSLPPGTPKPVDSMTKPELINELTAAGVAIPAGATAKDLKQLLKELHKEDA